MKKTKIIFMAIILSLSNIAEVISKEKNTDDILYQNLYLNFAAWFARIKT